MRQVLSDIWSVRQKGLILVTLRVLLCLAGAGAGKTAVLVQRVAYFIRQRLVAAENVYLVTFSKKAAAMLSARIRDAAGVDIHASTIHSLARAVILSAPNETGIEAEVLDENAQVRVIKRALKNHPCRNNLEPHAVSKQISGWKAHGFSAATVTTFYPNNPLAQAYLLYETAKGPALDFCDQITQATALLDSDAAMKRLWHDRIKYLAIDELQDTNQLQLRFLACIAPPDAYVFAVGDPDQGIYGFQGADVSSCIYLDAYFPEVTVLTLTENRRSTPNILNAAQRLIEHNKHRYPKALVPTLPGGVPIFVVDATDSLEEQDFVAAQIQLAVSHGIPLDGIAVVARTQAIVGQYTAFLKGKGFEIARHRYDQDFWGKSVIASAVAVIAAVGGVASDQDWSHVLSHLPQADQLSILQHARSQCCVVQSFAEAGTLPQMCVTVQGRAYAAELTTALQQLRQQSLDNVGRAILQNRKALGFLEGKGVSAAHQIENDLQEFANAVADLATQPDVSTFHSLYNRLSATGTGDGNISILTAHTVKGLEFSWVFVVGCEEGLFPHFYATNTNNEDMEEERRLFYVAMTRAKDRLFLLHARKRRVGKGRAKDMYPSRFLAEIGTSDVKKIDACVFLKGAI